MASLGSRIVMTTIANQNTTPTGSNHQAAQAPAAAARINTAKLTGWNKA